MVNTSTFVEKVSKGIIKKGLKDNWVSCTIIPKKNNEAYFDVRFETKGQVFLFTLFKEDFNDPWVIKTIIKKCSDLIKKEDNKSDPKS